MLDSRIFVVRSSPPAIFAYDSEGQYLGSLKFPQASRLVPKAPRWHASPQRNHLLADGDRVYLSWKGRIIHWDINQGEAAEVIEFGRPVRLVAALPDRLILADPDTDALLAAVDRQGQTLFRFGQPLVAAKNPRNNEANRFFVFHHDGLIRVLFQHYPIYRVYDLEGKFVEEGRYETPSRVPIKGLDPSLDEISESDAEFDSWMPVILQARSGGSQIHVYFNAFVFGLLDDSLHLVFQRFLLQDPAFAASPRVIDIDTDNGRLLLFEAQAGQPNFKFFTIR